MQLEDVALAALLPPPPVVRSVESEVSIEIVFEDDDLADAARTMQFVRFSAPYERIELSEVAPLPQQRVRPTSFAKTVTFGKGTPCAGVPSLRPTVKMAAIVPRDLPLAAPPSVTAPFERVWFDDEENVGELEEPAVAPKRTWWWLAISLAAGAAAVVGMASL